MQSPSQSIAPKQWVAEFGSTTWPLCAPDDVPRAHSSSKQIVRHSSLCDVWHVRLAPPKHARHSGECANKNLGLHQTAGYPEKNHRSHETSQHAPTCMQTAAKTHRALRRVVLGLSRLAQQSNRYRQFDRRLAPHFATP